MWLQLELGQIRLLDQDDYGLTQTKGGRQARTVMGPRNDLRWSRKLHDNKNLESRNARAQGDVYKTKMNLLYLLYKEFEPRQVFTYLYRSSCVTLFSKSSLKKSMKKNYELHRKEFQIPQAKKDEIVVFTVQKMNLFLRAGMLVLRGIFIEKMNKKRR